MGDNGSLLLTTRRRSRRDIPASEGTLGGDPLKLASRMLLTSTLAHIAMTVTATQFTRRSDEDIAASFAVALAPSTDGRFVVRHNAPNESFFYLGDTAWELFHRLSYEEAEVFLRNRAEKGFNVVMAVVLAEQR